MQINGTQVHVYDADEFTRRTIPGLLPRERAPVPDNTFSITPRRGPTVLAHGAEESQVTEKNCVRICDTAVVGVYSPL